LFTCPNPLLSWVFPPDSYSSVAGPFVIWCLNGPYLVRDVSTVRFGRSHILRLFFFPLATPIPFVFCTTPFFLESTSPAVDGHDPFPLAGVCVLGGRDDAVTRFKEFLSEDYVFHFLLFFPRCLISFQFFFFFCCCCPLSPCETYRLETVFFSF